MKHTSICMCTDESFYHTDIFHCQLHDCSLQMVMQAPLFMEFYREEYWSGFPFPAPGDLPDPRIKTMSPALAG